MMFKISFITFLTMTFSIQTALSHEHNHHCQKHPMSSMENGMMMEEASTPTVKLTIQSIRAQADKKHVTIKLTQIKDGFPVTLDDLKEMHTKKIHLLIIDDSLEDYSHIHPTATKEPGVYEFEWQPKKQGSYHIWANILPIDTKKEEYDKAILTGGSNQKVKINKAASLKSTVDGFTFDLSFDPQTLRADKASMGSIMITNKNGKPVKNLEPIMGAFAHIVGFSEDLKDVVHIHPMGKEPNNPLDRGGPKLSFHIIPPKKGFMKLFAQVRIHGQELFAPFGIKVKNN